MIVKRIISGGQTGVDRAALDVAIELGIVHGGWCPAGRRAEDGRIPDGYDLRETGSSGYEERTRKNAREATATIVIVPSSRWESPGTTLTIRACMFGRAHVATLDAAWAVDMARSWLSAVDAPGDVRCLNVAGPRASKWPGGYDATRAFLRTVLR